METVLKLHLNETVHVCVHGASLSLDEWDSIGNGGSERVSLRYGLKEQELARSSNPHTQ